MFRTNKSPYFTSNTDTINLPSIESTSQYSPLDNVKCGYGCIGCGLILASLASLLILAVRDWLYFDETCAEISLFCSSFSFFSIRCHQNLSCHKAHRRVPSQTAFRQEMASGLAGFWQETVRSSRQAEQILPETPERLRSRLRRNAKMPSGVGDITVFCMHGISSCTQTSC